MVARKLAPGPDDVYLFLILITIVYICLYWK